MLLTLMELTTTIRLPGPNTNVIKNLFVLIDCIKYFIVFL